MFSGDGGSVIFSSLSSKTPMFGLRLYTAIAIFAAVILAGVGAAAVVIFLYRRRRCRRRCHVSVLIPTSTKEIAEIKPLPPAATEEWEWVGTSGSTSEPSSSAAAAAEEKERTKKKENIGWGRWYSLAELEMATENFNPKNVIGEGGYGIVYKGVLGDGSIVAVKNLLNNKGQAEKEFKVEVEAIGKVRHKNLVGLIGYCAEGSKRMLVYEYLDNGNLEQWLRGEFGSGSPLSWDIRMKIAIGTAKGIAYLHEGLEPTVVHRDIKSSNILLDKNWNPKVSDFGLAKLLGSGSSYVTTRVMGTFGYVAPEYASTGMLNVASDVYSFGVLLMEIISGRSPIDYGRPAGEVNLVEWFKGMVASRKGEEVIDPSIDVQPSPRALKRVLLVCLRCIDMDAQTRPKMGHVVHMLEGDEFPFRLEHRAVREPITRSPDANISLRNGIPVFTKTLADDSERSLWR